MNAPDTTQLAETANRRLAENNTAEAYPYLSQIADALAKDVSSQMIAGCAAVSLGKFSEAREWFKRARAIDPAHLEAYHNIGLTHVREGAFVRGAEEMQAAVDSGVVDSALMHDLGLAYLQSHQASKARECLYDALRMDPAHDISRDALLELCRATSDNKRARRYVRNWTRNGDNTPRLAQWKKTLEEIESGLALTVGEQGAVDESPLSGKRIALFATHDSFLGDIKAHLAQRNTLKCFQAGALAQMREALEWCDIAWFEWCDDLLIYATTHLPKTCPIICRLHSYEAFTDMPEKVDWSKVDLVVFVNGSVESMLKPRIPESVATMVIPNAVDTERFVPRKTTYGKKIAYVGYINYKKNPQLLLYIMAELRKWDPEFELHIAGQHQDSRIELYLNDMAKKLGVEIHYHGWIEDMAEFYQEMDFVISTSLFESFHLSIAEGMACGLIPLVHDWFGAAELYPDKFRFGAPSECVEIIKRSMQVNRKEIGAICREHIVKRFNLPDHCAAVERAIKKSLSNNSMEDKTIDLGLVSIIVPTYNRADLLPQAISSALNQTYPHCEIVVVNDGSTDSSRELLAEYERRFPGKVRVIHQQNKGVSSALNTAIKNSRGEYISWLSSDDAYHPDKVWEQIKVLGKRPDLGWVYSDFFFMGADSTLQKRAQVVPLTNESFVEAMFEGNPIHGCSVMFRKSNLEKTGLFDEELGGKIGFGADGALWHKMGYHYKFAFIDKALVYYRLHPGQVTHQADIPKAEQEYRTYMGRYFESLKKAEGASEPCSIGLSSEVVAEERSLRLGFNADPDFPEEKPGGQRILWIGSADPCGNAAMYARAINRYTEHLCRVVTFKEERGFDHDIVLRRQRWAGNDGFSNDLTPAEEERLRDLAERADVLVFSACSYVKMSLPSTKVDDTDQLKWGVLDWSEYTRRKPCVAFFFGSTATRANADWYWNLYNTQKRWRVATGQIDLKRRWKDSLYVPTWLDVDATRYKRDLQKSEKILVVQTPTDPPIKNSKELETAVRSLLPEHPELSLAIKTGLSYADALDLKRQGQIALDQMQAKDGYYCMSSLENSALGLANFVYVDKFGREMIRETLGTDRLPWRIVRNEQELRNGIERLLKEPDDLFALQQETYSWMREYWHPSRLVDYLTDAILGKNL